MKTLTLLDSDGFKKPANALIGEEGYQKKDDSGISAHVVSLGWFLVSVRCTISFWRPSSLE